MRNSSAEASCTFAVDSEVDVFVVLVAGATASVVGGGLDKCETERVGVLVWERCLTCED